MSRCAPGPRYRRPGTALGIVALVLILPPGAARAQLSIGSTTGVLPPPATSSVILGSDLASFQAAWASPVHPIQQTWRNTVNGRANQNPSGAFPSTFSQAASDASIAQAAGLRYAMTGNVADLNKAAGALGLMVVTGGTSIIQPEVLTSYLSAYDFIRGAPLADLPQATRDLIEGRLTFYTAQLSSGGTDSNAKGKIGGTRGLAGVILRNQAFLDQGLTDLQAHFNYSTTDDGWYTDSQGHYLNYIMRHVSLFARAYEQASGVDLYPALRPLADMSIALRKPDGTTPNVSNGLNYGVGMHLLSQSPDAEMASATMWYLQQLPVSAWDNTNLQNNDYSSSTYFALTDFSNVTPVAPTASPTFFATGQSHVSVFRQDWGPTSDYLLLSPGVDSPHSEISGTIGTIKIPAFHSHNDTGEILVSARGKYLLVAPGYNRTDLTNSPPGFDPQRGDWHNVVLVDGVVGDPVVPEIVDPENGDGGRIMRPENFAQTNPLDGRELGAFRGVSDFATLAMRYQETDVARSIAFPGEDYFVVFDRMQSLDEHDYGFNLVGRGTQTVHVDTPEKIVVGWEWDGAQAIEHLVSTHDLTLSTGSLYMHDTFNVFETTQRMTGTIQADEAAFLSVIETADAGAPSRLDITRLAGSADHVGLEVRDAAAGWTDTILAQWAQIERTVGPLASDAPYAYTREADGELLGSLISGGTTLWHDGRHVLETSDPVTLSLLYGETTILGTLSGDELVPDTELRLYGRNIVSATLDGAPLPFTNQPSYGQIVLPSGGALEIGVFAVPEPSSWLILALGGGFLVLHPLRRRRQRRL